MVVTTKPRKALSNSWYKRGTSIGRRAQHDRLHPFSSILTCVPGTKRSPKQRRSATGEYIGTYDRGIREGATYTVPSAVDGYLVETVELLLRRWETCKLVAAERASEREALTGAPPEFVVARIPKHVSYAEHGKDHIYYCCEI